MREPGASDPTPNVSDVTAACDSQPAVVTYEYSAGLTQLLEQHELSLLISTYQAGQVVSLGVRQGQLQVGFARFDQAMGLARTPTGVVVGSRNCVWTLPANQAIAPKIEPECEHDIALLSRMAHYSGPVMGHDLAWCGDRLWLVNTLFNGLVTLEGDWSFVPRWKPPFISTWAPLGDNRIMFSMASILSR